MLDKMIKDLEEKMETQENEIKKYYTEYICITTVTDIIKKAKMIISAALIVSIFLYILIFRYYVNSTKDIILPIVIFILLNVTLNIVNNVYTKIYKYFYIYTSVDAKVPLEEIELVARDEIKYINEQVNKLLEEIEREDE